MAKRKNRTLLDMVRSMMSYSDLPNFIWGYDLETTVTRLVYRDVQHMCLKERLGSWILS